MMKQHRSKISFSAISSTILKLILAPMKSRETQTDRRTNCSIIFQSDKKENEALKLQAT